MSVSASLNHLVSNMSYCVNKRSIDAGAFKDGFIFKHQFRLSKAKDKMQDISTQDEEPHRGKSIFFLFSSVV